MGVAGWENNRMNEAVVVFFILVLIGLLGLMVSTRKVEEQRETEAFREATGLALRSRRANPVAGLFGLLVVLVVVLYGFVNPLAFVGLGLGAITAAVAQSRGSPNFLGWWGVGALLPVLSIPLAFLVPDRRRDDLLMIGAAARRVAQADREAEADDDDEWDPFDGPPAGGYPSWVAGLAHRPAEVRRRLAQARPGEGLVLLRDPFNEVDPRAVKLKYAGEWIGFVPAKHVAWVSERMDAGKPLLAEIETVDIADGRAERVWIRLKTS